MTAWLRARRESADDAEKVAAARIATLARGDPAGALAQITRWLGGMGEASGRELTGSLNALELLDHAARSRYRDTTRLCLQGQERLTDAALCGTVNGCLTLLAQRYQSHVVRWRRGAGKYALPKSLLVRSLTGGVRACAAVLKWSYLQGSAAPVGVWADMCTLYGAAEAASCARTPSPGQHSGGEGCVEREFLKGCMLAAGAPETLAPKQIDIAERLAGYCAADLGLAYGAHARYAWFIDLEAGEPPGRLDPAVPVPARVRSFGMDSHERFRRLLYLVETDRLAPAALGVQLDKAGVMQVLQQLARHWLPVDGGRAPLASG